MTLNKGLNMAYILIDPSKFTTISQRAEAVRKDNSLTRGEMCEIMQTSRHLYNQNQKGKYPFLAIWAINICEKLNVNLEWLYYGKGLVYKTNLGDQ